MWSVGDVVLLEAVPPFRLPLEHSRKGYVPTQQSTVGGQRRTCELSWDVLCVVCGRRGFARSGSSFSGYHENFYEMAIF
jgi:hypothetical protein